MFVISVIFILVAKAMSYGPTSQYFQVNVNGTNRTITLVPIGSASIGTAALPFVNVYGNNLFIESPTLLGTPATSILTLNGGNQLLSASSISGSIINLTLGAANRFVLTDASGNLTTSPNYFYTATVATFDASLTQVGTVGTTLTDTGYTINPPSVTVNGGNLTINSASNASGGAFLIVGNTGISNATVPPSITIFGESSSNNATLSIGNPGAFTAGSVQVSSNSNTGSLITMLGNAVGISKILMGTTSNGNGGFSIITRSIAGSIVTLYGGANDMATLNVGNPTVNGGGFSLITSSVAGPIMTLYNGVSGSLLATLYVGPPSATGSISILSNVSSGPTVQLFAGATNNQANLFVGSPSNGNGGFSLVCTRATGPTMTLFQGASTATDIIGNASSGNGGVRINANATTGAVVTIYQGAGVSAFNMGSGGSTFGDVNITSNVSTGALINLVGGTSSNAAKITMGANGSTSGDVQINSGTVPAIDNETFGNTPNVSLYGTTANNNTGAAVSMQWYRPSSTPNGSCLTFVSRLGGRAFLFAAGFSTVSNFHLKENFKTLDYVSMMKEINVYQYNFKKEAESRIGIVAQEVNVVMNKYLGRHNVVGTGLKEGQEDGEHVSWYVNESSIALVGLGAIKQYSATNDQEIATLKQQNQDLLSRIEKLELLVQKLVK